MNICQTSVFALVPHLEVHSIATQESSALNLAAATRQLSEKDARQDEAPATSPGSQKILQPLHLVSECEDRLVLIKMGMCRGYEEAQTKKLPTLKLLMMVWEGETS